MHPGDSGVCNFRGVHNIHSEAFPVSSGLPMQSGRYVSGIRLTSFASLRLILRHKIWVQSLQGMPSFVPTHGLEYSRR